MRALPDYLDYNLKIIFVGYNPGERSAFLKHHYAGYNNHFWKLLYESGLTTRLYNNYEDSLLLEEGYGLTNIVDRPSKSSSDLSIKELKAGANVLREKIKRYHPNTVCFLGKEIYRLYAGLKSGSKIPYGLVYQRQTSSQTQEFVAYNPSGRSYVTYEEKLKTFYMLKQIIS
ncbi:MAG: mismatch-specific DNA-glycosylase [Deltaproteobacteria bacterium]